MRVKKFFSKFHLKPIPNFQLAYFLVLLNFLVLLGFCYDNDFWFTINQGRYVLAHGFPTTTIYSIHNFDFIYQSWGSGVLYYLVYNYLGLYGIAILKTIIGVLTMYFFYKLCYLVSNNKRGSLIISLIAFFLYCFYIVTRPHIFTIMNLVIMLYLLESYVRKNEIKYLFWLPLITLFQINMHGIYFILLLIIVSPYLINSFKFKIFNIKSDGYRKKPLIIAFLCMILTGFLNPYGYKTIIYGFSSYQSNSLFNNTIEELMALNFHQTLSKIYIIVIIITIVLHFSKLKERPLRYTLLLIGTSYLAFDALKSVYLFVFCSLFPLTLLFKKSNRNIDDSYSKKYHLFHRFLTIGLCIGTIFLMPKPKDPVVKKFADYLDQNVATKENIKLFTDYYSGSYMEYRGYNCYLDPRGEVFLKSNNKKEDIYKEFDDLLDVKIYYKDFIDKYQFDYMIIEKRTSLETLMIKDSYNYNFVMQSGNFVLYELTKES